MKRISLFFVLATILISTVAIAADISFKASWEAPLTDINGGDLKNPPDYYRLYACESSITANPNTDDNTPIGFCSGSIKMFKVINAPTESSPYEDVYTIDLTSGTIYFRVSAVREGQINGKLVALESDLSNEAVIDFETVTATNPPGMLKIEGLNPIIIIR